MGFVIVCTIDMKYEMAYRMTFCRKVEQMSFQMSEDRGSYQPHPGLIIAWVSFKKPCPLIVEVDYLSDETMSLLLEYAYPFISGYAKFTIAFTMPRSSGEEITFTLGEAIPLTDNDNELLPEDVVYDQIYDLISEYAEMYEGEYVLKLTIRVYMDDLNKDINMKMTSPPSRDEIIMLLPKIKEARSSRITPLPDKARKIENHKRTHPNHITALKQSRTELKPFIVADTETLLINNVHKPYAAGLLLVRPGKELNEIEVETFFSEEYLIIQGMDSFEERSTKVLDDMIFHVSILCRKEKFPLTVYFHNFSRFDGILLLKHLACHHKSYKLKPMMRNNRLYELAVYSGKKLIFRIRDSLNLLPGNLKSLAKNLCPELGTKGDFDHTKVNLDNLLSKKTE